MRAGGEFFHGTPPPSAPERDYAPQEIRAFVRRITNLHEGPLILPDIVALGDMAVPELESLLRGPPDSIHQPRCLVADALATIGSAAAIRALIHAVQDSITRELEPMQQAAEDTVVNHIAGHLADHAQPAVSDILLAALRVRAYPYCALALGKLRDPRAIPLLVRCLQEDSARWAALEALRQFARLAESELIDALAAVSGPDGFEPPTWAEGRAAAVTLLGEIGGKDALDALAGALEDAQRTVRVAAALALARRSPRESPRTLPILVDALDEPNCTRADPIIEALVQAGARAGEYLLALISSASSTPGDTLRRLRAVRIAGRIQMSAAVPVLAKLADSDDPTLRVAALTALGRISTGSQ